MRKKLFYISYVLGVILLFFGASVVQGFETEQNQIYEKLKIYSFTPTDDSYLDEWQPEKIRGSGISMKTRNTGSAGYACDAILRFDISSIPPDTSIVYATLKLYYYKWWDNNPSGRLNKIYRVTSDWDEVTASWNNQPSYASTTTSTSSVPSYTGIWMEFDVLNDVLNFINGTYLNYGWRIKDENYGRG